MPKFRLCGHFNGCFDRSTITSNTCYDRNDFLIKILFFSVLDIGAIILTKN